MTEHAGAAGRVEIRRRVAVRYLGGCCSVCGSTEDLQFDHVDPAAKMIDIGDALWRTSELRFWQEVDKCQLLCSEHHRRKTREDAAAGLILVGRPTSLTAEQVAEAVLLYRRGRATFSDLGKRYDVATSTVWRAIRQAVSEPA